MTQSTIQRWKQKQDAETSSVEKLLRTVFPDTDAYRYNSASIRVRVIDARFEGKTNEERDAMVEPLIDQLPPETQADIINLLTLTPNETSISTSNSLSKALANLEFEDPGESML